MGINDLIVKNLFESYGRQDRLGLLTKRRSQAAPSSFSDKLSLSPTASKIAVARAVASGLVNSRQVKPQEDKFDSEVDAELKQILKEFEGPIHNNNITPEALKGILAAKYGKKS